jgi:hypothetical protein
LVPTSYDNEQGDAYENEVPDGDGATTAEAATVDRGITAFLRGDEVLFFVGAFFGATASTVARVEVVVVRLVVVADFALLVHLFGRLLLLK